MTNSTPILSYDYTLSLTRECGAAGLTELEVERCVQRALNAIGVVSDLRDASATSFVDLPDLDISEIDRVAAELRSRFDNFVVIGIGGSSLGARATYEALTRPYSLRHRDGRERDGLRLHFVENVDSIDLGDLLDSLDLERTAFNVITKSGSTIETMSNFFIVRDRLRKTLGQDGYRDRLITTTDPQKSWLLDVARDEGLRSFSVPPGVGGRYSVLSAVGLLPLAAAGIDVFAILDGARALRDAFFDAPDKSPVTLFAAVQVGLYDKQVGDVVFMPYIERLAATSEWFVQLWAESLGKRDSTGECIGPTPVAALGARDQHSLLQLLMEGPINKNVVFMTEARTNDTVVVPPPPDAAAQLQHLSGHALSYTVNAELRGVAAGLRESGRPSSEFILDELNARTYGAFLMAMELSTSLAGRMMGINPFDQPGVELGKRYAHGILGRKAEADYAERLNQWLANTDFATANLIDLNDVSATGE